MKTCPTCQMRYPSDGVFCFVDGATLVSLQDPRLGSTVGGRYVLEEVIGEGGMAIVYRARHKLVDRPCAVKIMNVQLAKEKVIRERFRREAKSAQALAHPNIIEIFDQGDTDDGTSYIVMELLRGESLAETISRGAISVKRAVPIMIQMARGIARAHDLGVIHRDLKPENTFVCKRDDGTDLVKLLDFGIARSRSDSRLTNAGELFGTPQYMAPERVTSGDAGPNVDLYALGVMFFELVVGRLPFDAPDIPTFLVKHLKELPPSPRSIDADIPEELDSLILKLLEKDPKARPVDAHKVEGLLLSLATALGIEPPPDAEHDPESQHESPARTLPAVALHQWARRTYVFEQMLTRAYGGSAPLELSRLLSEVTDLVKRVTDVRATAVKEQRAIEEIEKRGKEGRQRFGFAVDALGLDTSKAKDELRISQERAAELKEKVKSSRVRYEAAQREAVVWEGRSGFQEPSAQLSQAYRACAVAVDEWLAWRTQERRALAAVEVNERTVSDLEYQIRELRAALANHEKAIETEHGAAEKKIIEMNRQAEQMEASLLQLATRFCAPLRGRPELGPLFQQLESGAAA